MRWVSMRVGKANPGRSVRLHHQPAGSVALAHEKKMPGEYAADDSAWRIIMTRGREEGFQGRTINRRRGREKEEEGEEKSVGVREGVTKDLGRRRAVMGDK